MNGESALEQRLKGYRLPTETAAQFKARIRKREAAKAARRADRERTGAQPEWVKDKGIRAEEEGMREAANFGIPLPKVQQGVAAARGVPEEQKRTMTRGQHRMLLLTNFKEFCAAGKVENKERQRVPFLWNKPQRKLNVLLGSRLATNEPVYAAIAKARRWGCSLDVTWWMGWQMLRKPGTAVCLVLHHKDYLDEFRNRYRSMFESLPDYVVGKIEIDNAQKLVLSNGSRVDFYTAGTAATASQVGRSTGYHWCHATEVPFWHAPEQTFTALMGSMQLGPQTGVIVESTPKGAYGKFFDMYMQAKRGESDYIPYFVPWHAVEEYVIKPTRDQIIAWDKWRTTKDDKWRVRMGSTSSGKATIVPDDEGRIDRFNLRCEQYLWWCDTLRNRCGGDLNQMKQEFGDDDVTCFLTAAKLGFEQDEIALVKHMCDRGREQWRECGIVEDEDGVLRQSFDSRVFRVREAPVNGAQYMAIMDPALGGQTADWSVLYVFRRTVETLQLVAKCKTRAMPDGAVDLAARLLAWYGDPLLAIESNRGEGHIHEFRVRNYPRLLRRSRINVITGQPIEDALGLYMSDGVRQVCIKNLHKYLRTGRLQIPDDDFYSEMHTFVLDEASSNKKYLAAKGCHDDHIITAGMACYLDETYPVDDVPTLSVAPQMTFLGAQALQAGLRVNADGFVPVVNDEPLSRMIVRSQAAMDND